MRGQASRGLEFTVLTAVRTGEALGARWDEIDLMKRSSVVPRQPDESRSRALGPACTRRREVLQKLYAERRGDYVFPGERPRKPLSNMSMLMLLRRMGRSDLTTHGFRSTFRDWVAEQTNFPREVAEAALAHVVGDKVEAAYRRGDLFEKRRSLMDQWTAYSSENAVRTDLVNQKARVRTALNQRSS